MVVTKATQFRIETDRFSWGGKDTFDTQREARTAVREFLQDCRDQGQSRWYRTDFSEPDVIVEYEHVSWDPSKPERVRIVRSVSQESAS